MRLIDTEKLDLEQVAHCHVKKYAILSHRWTNEEVTLENLTEDRTAAKAKAGFQKIDFSCKQAIQDCVDYVWVDTCCIDKSSSAELSEAINSMYYWYQEAEVCYAYLSDVPDDITPSADGDNEFKNSEWFKRGWTLQELVAPRNMIFFSRGWKVLGTKKGLKRILANITRIDAGVLDGTKDLNSISVAKRMSWAATRETSRTEDEAYCLMGLFNVNMPMLYGEGGEKAFVRLEEQIMQDSDDESIFAWRIPAKKEGRKDDDSLHGLLATSPKHFADSDRFMPYCDWQRRLPFSKTNKGLQISLHLTRFEGDIYVAALNCPAVTLGYSGFLAIFLKRLGSTDDGNPADDNYHWHYARIKADKLPSLKSLGNLTTLYVRQNNAAASLEASVYPEHVIQLRRGPSLDQGYRLLQTMGHHSKVAMLMFKDREWIPSTVPSIFQLGKGVAQLATVLVFERITDGSKFAVMIGSTTNFGIAFDVQEWVNEKVSLFDRGARLESQPGEEVEMEREIVGVEVREYINAGKKYYVVDVTVRVNPQLTVLDVVAESVSRAVGLPHEPLGQHPFESMGPARNVKADEKRGGKRWYRNLLP
ncbi:het domain-containing protein [Neofusicoccum parvum]|nr:het domain-containing protein [Neofusicoccum parvum]